MLILKLQDLFERDLEIVYDCERRLIKELPKLIEVASSGQLQNALNLELQQSEAHVDRLDRIFASLTRSPAEEPDHALKGISAEGEKLIKNIDRSALLDSALIIFGSQVHHHKIALYGSLSALARVLGFTEATGLLEQAMNEDKAGEERLILIAASVNPDALSVRNTPHDWLIV